MANGVQLYRHPQYLQMQARWEMWRDLYDGDHDTICQKYLWYHALERKSDTDAAELRAARVQRTRYLNFLELIISIWGSIFFRNEPKPDQATADMLGEYSDDIDGQGSSLYSFVKDRVLLNYLLYGDVYILADAFPFSATTQLQARQSGARPFLEVMDPLQVVDWDIETGNPARLGQFNVFRHEFDVLMPRMTATEMPLRARVSHSLELVDGKYTIKIYRSPIDQATGNFLTSDPQSGLPVFNLVETVDTQLDSIPIAYIKGDSWIKDVAEETLRHLNLRSNLDNINYYQGYQKMFAKGIDPNAPDQIKALSAYVISILPRDGDMIFAEPVNTSSLEAALSECVNNIFKIGLNQIRSLSSDSKQVQAADSASQEKDYTYAQVESAIEDIENGVEQALNNFARFQGKEGFNAEYKIDREIKSEDMAQWIQIYTAFQDKFTNNYPDVDRAAVKKAICKLSLPNEEELIKGVDALPVTTPKAATSQARTNLLNGIMGTGDNGNQ